MELRNLGCLVALQNVQFANLKLGLCSRVVAQVIRLQNAGTNLDQTVASDERIYNGFKDKGGLGLQHVKIRLEDLVGLHVDAANLAGLCGRHVFYNIIHQRIDTLCDNAGTHLNRNNRSVLNGQTCCRTNLCL